ncbi:MAG: hypothetical protein AVO33_04785 [delta proteobacterium ML8_F1]|nr:MAG: hypothetical protein AVO33_04785 [delta proteobacterium ML8_F1]
MTRLRHLSIRDKLLLMLAAALTPALGIILYTGWEQRAEAVADAHKEAVLLADSMAVQQALLVASISTMFDTLAHLSAVRDLDSGQCAPIFQGVLNSLPFLTNIGLFSPAGEMLATGKPLPPFNNKDSRQFRLAVDRKAMAAGEFVLGRVTGDPSFQFAFPVLDEAGQLLAVLQAGYQLSIFDNLFMRAGLPEGAVLAVIDHDGRRLYRFPPTTDYPNGEHIPAHLWQRFSAGQRSGAFEALGGDRQPRLFAFQTLVLPQAPDAYMTFHISVPRTQALAQARHVLFRNMAFLGFSICSALLLAWLLSKKALLIPLRGLVRAADSLGQGRLDTRTGLDHTPNELGRLARAFDHMAVRLQKQTKALRQAEEEYRTIFEQAMEGIFQSTPEGRFIRVNPAMAAIFGYDSPRQMLAEVRDIGADLYGDPGDRDRFVTDLREQGMVRDREIAMRTRNGEQIWVSLSARLVRDDHGQPLRIEGNNLDITQRKQAEGERENLQAQLLQSQKLESIGLLAGGVAHDFNNMLQAILGNAEVALGKSDPSAVHVPYVQRVVDSAARSRDLVRQLLAFARKQTISPKVLDLNTSLHSMLAMLERLVDKNIALRWLPGKDVWPVCIDPVQLDQILANLVLNSRDAVREVQEDSLQAAEDSAVGGEICMETSNVVLDETYTRSHAQCRPGEYVLLAVSDTGTGMDAQTLRNVFDPYFTTKEQGKGTGLGLSTVYGIVKQNAGIVHIYSEPGKGTTVKVYLPRAREAALSEAEAAQEQALPQGSGTVLLVEDEPAILELTTEVLHENGYTVLAAATPDQALEMEQAQAGPVHLLITDVVMPGMNGRQLQDLITARRPEIRTLFMSGYTANVVVRNGVLDQDVHFLQKPFSVQTLLAAVHRILAAEDQLPASQDPAGS